MRVVQVIPDFDLGGVQKAGCVVARAMVQMGHQVRVVGIGGGGPRFMGTDAAALAEGRLEHVVAPTPDTADVAGHILDFRPNVVHVHGAAYEEALVRRLAGEEALIVSTPVFGRPPLDPKLLRITRTCCVGLYTFYRLCRWLELSGEEAIDRAGIGYVPLTPYEPPSQPVSTIDDAATLAARRQKFGLPDGHLVVGRIGRETISKWHLRSEELVNGILSRNPGTTWCSVGYPQELGRQRLRERWRGRFVNLPETPDYALLTEVLASMDVQVFASNNGECFASTIAEAAGIGVPTVALANPLKDNGQAEQIIDGVTGVLVGDIASAADAIERLRANRSALEALKATSARHAAERWHVDRAAADLLGLYDAWRTGVQTPYRQVMLDEHAAFAAAYRARILQLMAGNPFSRAEWRAALSAVEWWPLFKIGRTIKRLLRG